MEFMCQNQGWLAALTHSAYWLSLLYFHQDNQAPLSQHTGNILLYRLIHFGLMGIGCLLFTVFTLIITYLFRAFGRKNSSVFEDNSPQHITGHTSYQQHSSSQEERKYMQQQLQQFNMQARKHDEDEGSDQVKQMQNEQSEEAKNHEIFQQNSKLNITSSSSSQAAHLQEEEEKRRRKQQLQQRSSSHHTAKSSQQINGQLFGTADERDFQRRSHFSWYTICQNYKVHLLFALSALMNVVSQILIAYTLDRVLMKNVPLNGTITESALCFVSINSLSIVILAFSLTYQFLCLPDTHKQPDENLASGIYLIFFALIALIISNIIVELDPYDIVLACTAFSLIGLRLQIIRIYLVAQSHKVSCEVLNMFHLWCEFGIFCLMAFIASYYFKDLHHIWETPMLITRQDFIQESLLTLIYIISLVTLNASVVMQTYFAFANQFIQSSFIILVALMLTRFVTLTLLIYCGVLLVLGLLIKLTYQSCRSLVIENLSNRKKQQYGSAFQEDQYEKFLQTPFASQIHDGDSVNNRFDQRMPPLRSNFEYYIVENEVSLLLKKRPCLDQHYKFNSIQHFSLKFYAINSFDLSQSQDTNQMQDKQDEQKLFMKAIENYQRRVLS